ncbi:3'-5' exonuclease [Luteimicrobium xylanilyticum]|uniref:DNA 3'-5' helicase n=1 Tax=Luteimicrobium xylanilyticum TaxID=1133546 RepID=A0A5P9QAP2_9MICO|nr:3'-5' exonuclease [Luteimicrobium xylanilyticum]QFU98513.1 DNA helicase [Luteimicrobium xylanilyticum]
MAEIIWQREAPGLDPAVHAKVSAFLGKLREDDTAPGLHIEKINGADPLIRTGRVNQQWRALLVRVQGTDGPPHYIYLGTYNHDEAIALAKTHRVEINQTNGVAELIKASLQGTPPQRKTQAKPAAKPKPDDISTASWSRLEVQGITVEDLVGLGMRRSFAEAAFATTDDDGLQELADTVDGLWQGYAMLDLAFGASLDAVRERYSLDWTPSAGARTEDDLLKALRHPAARLEFAFLETDEDFQAAIEARDFGAWRTFLHPEQRDYATRRRSGSFRVTGGAGTGKTVVLLHRARHLARQNPDARIVLTTYNTTLADSLRDNLLLLDSTVQIAPDLGTSGVYVAGVDAIARRVLASTNALGLPLRDAVQTVLGPRGTNILGMTGDETWVRAAKSAPTGALPEGLLTPAFLEAEYATSVLPHRVLDARGYARVPRRGRGVALNRAERNDLWTVVEGYRSFASLGGTTSFEEKAAVAAAALELGASRGGKQVADHVLVDEAQDLSPSRLLLLRALVAPGPDDLFLAEDAQQRIYGQKVVLAHYGIKISGRSRRLTLNYRTTAENLAFALRVLDGGDFEDLDGDITEKAGYRSARRGPTPELIEASGKLDEYARAATRLKRWIDDGDTPDELGVLVRSTRDVDTLLESIRSFGVPVQAVANRERPPAAKVALMTMHRAKGMEFRRVIMLGMAAGARPSSAALPEADQADAMQRQRSLIYVAATRARDELVVMWSGRRSSLVPSVKGEPPS